MKLRHIAIDLVAGPGVEPDSTPYESVDLPSVSPAVVG